MKMNDYLSSINGAVRPIIQTINESYQKLYGLDMDIHHWVHLENYLKGDEHNGHGPRNFDNWIKDMGEEPTVESVIYWRDRLEDIRVATKETINTLCASILMIAQNGIKLTIGKPSNWRASEDTIFSSQQECVLKAIWHGRNLGAHVEGLKIGTTSYKYFEDLNKRRQIDLLSSNCEYPCEIIVKDLLGWVHLYDLKIKDTIHKSYPSPFIQDMECIGKKA
jgi:hypothetical protein